MKNKPTAYIDSCCFIDAVKQEVGTLPTGRDKDCWYVKKLLEAHEAGDLAVCTSTLSLAECVAIEQGQTVVPDDVQNRFRRLLMSGQYLTLVPQTPATARIAQELRWKHQLVLGGPDALHIAAALERGADEFITTDERLKKPKVAQAASVLGTRGLRFITGSQSGILPAQYLQGKIFNA